MEVPRVAVRGIANIGPAAIRSAEAFRGLRLSGVVTSAPDKEGMDTAAFARLDDDTGVSATTDLDAALAGIDAVAYVTGCASSDGDSDSDS